MKGKTFIIVVLLAFTVPALAAGEDEKSVKSIPSFAERKAEVLKNLDNQILSLQETKTCIQAAKDHNAIKACREKQMAERKQLHEEMRKKIYRDEQQNK